MGAVVAIVGGVLIILSVGAWVFLDQIVIVWGTILFGFAKGVTIKSLLAWLAVLLKRWLLVEVPKKLLIILLAIGAPIRMRAWLRLFSGRLRRRVDLVQVRVREWLASLLGRHVAITVAAIASLLVFVVGVSYFGIYVVYVIGGGPLLTPVVRWLLRSGQHLVFRFVMFFHIDRLARFIVDRLPDPWLEALNATGRHMRRRIKAAGERFSWLAGARKRKAAKAAETTVGTAETPGAKTPDNAPTA